MTAPINTPTTDIKSPSGPNAVAPNSGQPAAGVSSLPAHADKADQDCGDNKKNDRSQRDSRAAVAGAAPASPPRHGESSKNDKTEMNDKKDANGIAPRDDKGIDRMANESNTVKLAPPAARPGA